MRFQQEVEQIKVKCVVYAGKADVYNMEVEDTHNFIVNGGIVAHNCYDSWRYCFMANPLAPTVKRAKPAKPFSPFEGVKR